MKEGVFMRFIHIADVHIGARPDAGKAFTSNREREILDTFKRVLEQCEKEKIELLLISGGLFHRQPMLSELKEVDYLFSKLTITKVVFIVGTSDYLNENTYYNSFNWSGNVYPIFTQNMSVVEIPFLQLAVYGCSYHNQEEEAEKFLEPISLAKQKYHILIGYGGCASQMKVNDMDQTTKVTERLKRLPYDYIGLGYQHKPEILVTNRIAYAGSLEPIRPVDVGFHGYMLGTLKEEREGESSVEITFVPFASRQYIQKTIEIDATMTNDRLKEHLLEVRAELGMNHMYQITLRGKRSPEVVFDIENLDDVGNIIKLEDCTNPDYCLVELAENNKDNLLGAYIKSFGNVEEGSIEYIALYEGVRAIEETKRS